MNFACVCYGKKYSVEYVQKLYNMVQRNTTLEHNFFIFTDNIEMEIDGHVNIRTFPETLNGWWNKMQLFRPDTLDGDTLYMDLDVIVFRNIDKLFSFKEGKFCVIRDFNRSANPQWQKFNSSVVRWQIGQHPQIYNDFIKTAPTQVRRFHGDQDWLYSQVFNTKDFEFWPDEWIMSYKWEMRNRPPMHRRQDGIRDFISPGVPNVKPETSIAVFHGDPQPGNCQDPWCKENWR